MEITKALGLATALSLIGGGLAHAQEPQSRVEVISNCVGPSQYNPFNHLEVVITGENIPTGRNGVFMIVENQTKGEVNEVGFIGPTQDHPSATVGFNATFDTRVGGVPLISKKEGGSTELNDKGFQEQSTYALYFKLASQPFDYIHPFLGEKVNGEAGFYRDCQGVYFDPNHITYEGGRCFGNDAYWIKMDADGNVYQAKNWHRQAHECGNS